MKTFLRIVACCMAVALGVAFAVGSTHAQPPGGGDSAAVEKARERMEKGQQLFAQGRYAEAGAEFEAAYAALPYGAFLYNAALAAEKALDYRRAKAHYEKFIQNHPHNPDAGEVRRTIGRLEQELKKPAPVRDAGVPADAGTAADAGLAGVDGDAGAAVPPTPADAETMAAVRSLVFIESDPPGAPLVIYERKVPTAAPFSRTGTNPGWQKIIENTKTPRDLSLRVGHYHVVIEAFADYKRSETDISLAPGHVYTFKANLSQGEFLGFLKVKSKVEGAAIYIDDPPPHQHAPWGRTPHSGLVGGGEHQVWVKAPGYEPFTAKVKVKHGQTADLEAVLARVGYGILRINGNADEVEIEIDGKEHGTWRAGEPPVQIKLPAGAHQVELDASGRNAYEGTIEVPRGQAVDVHAGLVESKDWVKPIGLTVVAAASVVGGVLFWRHADARLDDSVVLEADAQAAAAAGNLGEADELRRDAEDAEEQEEIFRWVGNGFMIGAGVFAAAAIFFYIYDPTDDSLAQKGSPREFKEDEAKKAARFHPRVMPLLGPAGGGIGISGVF